MLRIFRYCLADVARSRFAWAYALFYALTGGGLLYFTNEPANALAALLTVLLTVGPLATVVFGSLYFYQSRGFQELILAQPVGRRQLFAGQWLGLAAGISLAFLAGLLGPFLIFGTGGWGTMILFAGAGLLLHWVFLSIAFWISLAVEDKLKGFSANILIWLYLAVVYDGFLLLLLAWLSDYPVERWTLAAIFLNPVDLARIVVLLHLDYSALMGYTGAVFQKFFGSPWGMAAALGALAAWAVLPGWAFLRRARRQDF